MLQPGGGRLEGRSQFRKGARSPRLLSLVLGVLVSTHGCRCYPAFMVEWPPDELFADAGDAGDDVDAGEDVDAGDDGGPHACVPKVITAEQDVPNLYFVLDHSRSMRDNDKWSTMRAVVSKVMTTMGSTARFGAALFPDPASDSCDTGREVLPLRRGDSLGNTSSALLAATTAEPLGGTPTAATLVSLLPLLSSYSGSTFAILATDGGANCSTSISCSVDECVANIDGRDPRCQPMKLPNCCAPRGLAGPTQCLDSQATIDAVTSLKAANVPTFVLGMQGSAPYEQQLNAMAQAGGTARATSPLYYRVDSADSSALEAALTQIAAKITASCTVTLSRTPADPQTMLVKQGAAVVPEDPNNGWSLSGRTLTLHGTPCQGLLTGQDLDLNITDGCPLEK